MPVNAPTFESLGFDLPSDMPFTASEAVATGLNRRRLARLAQAGVLRRLLNGVYVASEVPDTLELRCAALGVVVPADAFICDTTAAWLYRGPTALPPNEHLSVPPVSCFRRSGRHRLRNTLAASGERDIRDEDLREINGLAVTTELRTALDLGRLQRSRDMRLWGMDTMLASGAFTHEQMLDQVERFKKQRGVVALRTLAPLADPLSQSFGESALRLRWYDAGLPRPRLQIPVMAGGKEIAFIDMGLEEWGFGGEYDGEEWHSEDEDVEHDAERRTWLRDQRGWWIEVFRKEHVFGHAQDADVRLRRAAAEARATLGERIVVV